MNNNNYNTSLEYMQTINIENFDSSNVSLLLKSNFITENSKDIQNDMIIHATSNIDRTTFVIKIAKLISDINIAILIEASVFEFALIHATLNSLDKQLVYAIYDDKLSDICMNLDETSRLGNKSFRSYVLEGIIDPKLVAFLSPDQTYPESFAPILNKIKFRQTTENNMATSDIYKCHKCGERKCKVNEMQLRSADESSSKFVTCLVCYNTFIK